VVDKVEAAAGNMVGAATVGTVVTIPRPVEAAAGNVAAPVAAAIVAAVVTCNSRCYIALASD
jgi:hypothetical protein